MANERDDAFTSTGIGGLNQERDFETGTFGASGGMGSDTSEGQPATARAREAVSTAGHKAVERVQERLADQVTRATGQLESVASSLRTAGAQMPDNGIGRYMVQAATQVDNLASFLNNREVGELVDEVEEFARRQPAVFIGGAFALGVLGARFLRSSRQNMGIDYDRGSRRNSFEGSYNDGYGRTTGSTSDGRPGDFSRSGYDTGYSGTSTSRDSDLSTGGYTAGGSQSSGFTGTPGGMTGSTGLGASPGSSPGLGTSSGPGASSGSSSGLGSSSSGLGASSGSGASSGLGASSGTGSSSGLGSSSTSRDLASDLPNRSPGVGTSTGGMSGSGTTGSSGLSSGGSTIGRDRRPGGSLSGDDETRTSEFGTDGLSARSGSGSDRESLDSEKDPRSPDFL